MPPEPDSRRQRLIHLESVDSTSAHLKRLALGEIETGTAVLADEQTAGYGQRGRSWGSARHVGMYLSVLVDLPAPPTLLPLAAGLAVCEALRHWTQEVRLKWVNDLVARRGKLGGVLVEVVRGRAIVGIGVNLHTPDVPGGIGLEALHPDPPSAKQLAVAVLSALDDRLLTWEMFGTERVRSDWLAACAHLGHEVEVEGLRGRSEGLGPAGELLLRLENGQHTAVISGSLRMADGTYCV
ncbi:MAG: biotin--[acetyl-CoA-carboxylase] ligase [Candidatus Sericytochromatia bacterium]|nr:biotin--[acetyl-CoA-carboxylase] ligase [Candidatus Sericytochromatia bacterium]